MFREAGIVFGFPGRFFPQALTTEVDLAGWLLLLRKSDSVSLNLPMQKSLNCHIFCLFTVLDKKFVLRLCSNDQNLISLVREAGTLKQKLQQYKVLS